MRQTRELTPEQIKEVSLKLLIQFDRLCRDNGIRYSLGMGTLLGAVRHGGFIPWDDDVDVIMTRPEYQKLLRIDKALLPRDCALFSIERERLFTAPLAKLIDTTTVLYQTDHVERIPLGIYIDIFVYDALPADRRQWDKTFRRGDTLQRLWTASEMKPVPGEKNPVKIGYKHLAARLDLARFFAGKLSRYAQRVPFENGAHVANLYYSTFPRNKFTFPRAATEQFRDICFEGHWFTAFEDTDLFLRAWYGDYMKLPPREQRKGHHKYSAYCRGES